MAAERPNARKSAEVSIKASRSSKVESPKRPTSSRRRLSPLANTLGRVALVGGALAGAGYGGWLINEAYDNDYEDTHRIVLALPGSGNVIIADSNSGNIGNIDNHSENNTSTDTETNKEISNNKNKDFGPKELPNTGFGQQFSIDRVKSLIGSNLEIELNASKRKENFDTLTWAIRDRVEEITGVVMDDSVSWSLVDAIAKDNGKESGSTFNVLADGQNLDLRIGDNTAQVLRDNVIPLSAGVLAMDQGGSGLTLPSAGTGSDENENEDGYEHVEPTSTSISSPEPTITATPIATGTASSEQCIETDVKGDLEDENHFSKNPVKGVVSNVAQNVTCLDDIYIHMYGSMLFPETGDWIGSQKGNHIKTIKIDVPEGAVDMPIDEILGEDVIVPNTEFCWVQVDLTTDGEIKEEPRYINNDHVFVKDIDSCLPTATPSVASTATVTATLEPGNPPVFGGAPRFTQSPTPSPEPTESPSPTPTKTEVSAQPSPTPPPVKDTLPNAGFGFSKDGGMNFREIAMYMAMLGTAAIAAGEYARRFRRRFTLGSNVLENSLDKILKAKNDDDEEQEERNRI